MRVLLLDKEDRVDTCATEDVLVERFDLEVGETLETRRRLC
jgi:hypothetical protein